MGGAGLCPAGGTICKDDPLNELIVTKTRLFEGVWEGTVSGAPAGQRPSIAVTHLDNPVDGADLSEGDASGTWVLRIAIPPALLSDGMHTLLIRNADTGATLNSCAILAGEALADDIRAEVTLLREELDLLKRAFRRHCLETS